MCHCWLPQQCALVVMGGWGRASRAPRTTIRIFPSQAVGFSGGLVMIRSSPLMGGRIVFHTSLSVLICVHLWLNSPYLSLSFFRAFDVFPWLNFPADVLLCVSPRALQ